MESKMGFLWLSNKLKKSAIDAEEHLSEPVWTMVCVCFQIADLSLNHTFRVPDTEIFRAEDICTRFSVDNCLSIASRIMFNTVLDIIRTIKPISSIIPALLWATNPRSLRS
jgi:hypothetical protein